MNKITRIFILTIGLLLLWHTIVIAGSLPNYILPTPVQVFTTLIQQYQLIADHALPTSTETILGFLFGIIFGCGFALLIASSKHLNRWFLPILIISQAIPTFAIAPLFVIWMGYGFVSKIATAALMVFFPIASSFYDGLRQVPTDWLNLAKTMNATKWRVFSTIHIPAALPHLASGLRIAAVSAPIGAIIGEWVGSSRGLGYLMLNANARMQIDLMFAALVVIVTMALVLYFTVDAVLRKWVWWG